MARKNEKEFCTVPVANRLHIASKSRFGREVVTIGWANFNLGRPPTNGQCGGMYHELH